MTSPSTTALTVYRPLVRVVVAALGALITHQLGYFVAGAVAGFDPAAGPDHGHLPLQWALVVPATVTAVGGLVVWQLRQLGFRSPISTRRLALSIMGVFAVQELVEGVAAGLGPTEVATSPAVLLGLVAAPLVAWLVTRILSGVTELVAALLRGDTAVPPSPAGLMPAPVRWTTTTPRPSSRPRAPPCPLRP